MTHGGKRTPGPGKKLGRTPSPDPKIQKTYRLEREIVAYLATTGNATREIETKVKRSKGFREWKRNNS
jgi:hypothetical protein